MDATTSDAVRRVLSQSYKSTIVDSSLVPAGVMLLLYKKNEEYHVLLNKRTDKVEHHKGEISFPGGRMEDEDADLVKTALRETHEEMGILPKHVELLGELDDIATNTGFLMSTFVGSIPYPYDFKPNSSEVAEVVEVPVSDLMDDEKTRDEIRIINGELINAPTYAHNGHLIHGATARILKRFVKLLDNAPDKEAPWRRAQPRL